MKNLIVLVFFCTCSLLQAQVQVHAINQSGGTVAKLESLSGNPQLDFDRGGVTLASLRLSNDDVTEDLIIENVDPNGKLMFKVGSGLVTINPNDPINGAYLGINTSSPIAPLTVNTQTGGGVADFRALAAEEAWAQFSTSPSDGVQATSIGFVGVVDNGHPNNAYNMTFGTTTTNTRGSLLLSTHNNIRAIVDSTGHVTVNRPTIAGDGLSEALRVNGEINIDGQYTLPDTDGSNGQVLMTDGNGGVTWSDVASSSQQFDTTHYSSWNGYAFEPTQEETFAIILERTMMSTKVRPAQFALMDGNFRWFFISTPIKQSNFEAVQVCYEVVDDPSDDVPAFITSTRVLKTTSTTIGLVIEDSVDDHSSAGCYIVERTSVNPSVLDNSTLVGMRFQLGLGDEIRIQSVSLITSD